MPEQVSILTSLGAIVVLSPIVLVAVLGVSSLLDRKLSEQAVAQAVYSATGIGFLAVLGVFGLMLWEGNRHLVVGFGNWVHIGHEGPDPHYHFAIKFVFDRLSIPFVALALVLCGTIGAFANRYMHRERGYNRFFALYSLFVAGMVMTSLAGTIETLFLGWELVGLSSALLVGFFHERPAPVRNAIRVWTVYRVSDAALLLAAVVLHHMSGEGDLDRLTGYHELASNTITTPSWPYGSCTLQSHEVLVVGFLLIIAAAGKSALVPFSGWLPRAMEGPTPSSAVFYGALSVHLGAFLLLRAGPVLDSSNILSGFVCVLGLLTAGYATLVGRVQTDIKSALSFASLTQVGLIVAEIGLGWRFIPLVHLLGHACLRTLQFVRAPTLLQDQRMLENALGDRLPTPSPALSGYTGMWLFRFALERGYLDAILDRFIAGPFMRFFRWLDRLERSSCNILSGKQQNQSEISDKVTEEAQHVP